MDLIIYRKSLLSILSFKADPLYLILNQDQFLLKFRIKKRVKKLLSRLICEIMIY